MSVITPVEVCGAISKRAGIGSANKTRSQLLKWEGMNFIDSSELTRQRRREAVELAIKLRMMGMDAIVVQVAKERGSILITFDEEVAAKAKEVVRVLTYEDFYMKR